MKYQINNPDNNRAEAAKGASYIVWIIIKADAGGREFVDLYRGDLFTFMRNVFSPLPNNGRRRLDHMRYVYYPSEEDKKQYYLELCDAIGIPPLKWGFGDDQNWAREYWRFLHNVSICIIDKPMLVDEFATIMLNFGLILYCSICFHHYNENGHPEHVYESILKGRDPIQTIIELHYHANSTRPRGPQPKLADIYRQYGIKRL